MYLLQGKNTKDSYCLLDENVEEYCLGEAYENDFVAIKTYFGVSLYLYLTDNHFKYPIEFECHGYLKKLDSFKGYRPIMRVSVEKKFSEARRVVSFYKERYMPFYISNF